MPWMVPQSKSATDGVLRDVDETTREVTGVRRLERGVGQTLAGAVGRDEVLENREALAEVRGDRGLDDLAGRLAMRPRIPASYGSAGSSRGRGVGHDEDRVERRGLLLLAVSSFNDHLGADLLHHLFRDAVGDLRPDINDLVVALTVGD